MILRHLAVSIREQNWFVVVLEILIVVVGIFIGLQVDDWNKSRQEQNQEQKIINSLRVEVNNNIETYLEISESLERQQAILVDYYDYLTGTREVRPEKADLLSQLCRVGLGQEAPYDNTVYEELLSTGRTGIISDEAVTAALRRYKLIQDRWQNSFDDVVSVAQDQYIAIHQYLDWRPFTPDDRYGDCAFDFPVFEADKRAAHNIAGAQRITFYYLRGTQMILELLIDLRATLNTGYPLKDGNGD